MPNVSIFTKIAFPVLMMQCRPYGSIYYPMSSLMKRYSLLDILLGCLLLCTLYNFRITPHIYQLKKQTSLDQRPAWQTSKHHWTRGQPGKQANIPGLEAGLANKQTSLAQRLAWQTIKHPWPRCWPGKQANIPGPEAGLANKQTSLAQMLTWQTRKHPWPRGWPGKQATIPGPEAGLANKQTSLNHRPAWQTSKHPWTRQESAGVADSYYCPLSLVPDINNLRARILRIK